MLHFSMMQNMKFVEKIHNSNGGHWAHNFSFFALFSTLVEIRPKEN